MIRSMNKRLSIVLLLALSTACGQSNPSGASGSPAATSTNPATSQALVARVNGAPITEADVELKLAAPMHEAGKMSADEKKQAVLDGIILRELMAQKALSMGLDKDPKYLEDLKKLDAQIADFKRTALSELLIRRENEKRTTPSDDEVRAYFTANEKRLRMQLHVLQILKRSEAEITEARSMIDRGKSFEEVAASFFPNLPEGQKPWDLGYLPFYKIPEPWRRTVYDMKPGEMSGVLRGPTDRYWLVKLVEIREDTAMTFESAKEAVIQDMKANKVQHVRESLGKELRAAGKVEILGK